MLDDRYCHYDDRSGTRPDTIERALSKIDQLPEVFFCSSDHYAVVLQNVLQSRGYRIPEDISIIGFDNLSEGQYQNPPVTTVDCHSYYLGELAARRLLRRMNEPELMHEVILCQSDIIRRGSSV